jgi:hypothetical protein
MREKFTLKEDFEDIGSVDTEDILAVSNLRHYRASPESSPLPLLAFLLYSAWKDTSISNCDMPVAT